MFLPLTVLLEISPVELQHQREHILQNKTGLHQAELIDLALEVLQVGVTTQVEQVEIVIAQAEVAHRAVEVIHQVGAVLLVEAVLLKAEAAHQVEAIHRVGVPQEAARLQVEAALPEAPSPQGKHW